MAGRSKNKGSKLGHDPLAWLDDDEAGANMPVADDVQNIATSPEESESQPAGQELGKKDVSGDVVEDTITEPVETLTSGGTAMFELPIYFGIAQVSEVKDDLNKLMAKSSEKIALNGSDIESIDTAAIQLLISFVSHAREQGKEVTFSGCSEKLLNTANLLNVTSSLNLD